METMSGWIVVPNVSKYGYVGLDESCYYHRDEAIDLLGFQVVPPGLHNIQLSLSKHEEAKDGCWLELQPGEVIVKVFNYDQQKFEDATDETTSRYQHLARSGELSQTLKPYIRHSDDAHFKNEDLWLIWQQLTKYLDLQNFPLTIHPFEVRDSPANFSSDKQENLLQHQKTHFEQALFDTHQGNINAFLAEFQYAFLDHHLFSDRYQSIKRWNDLVKAIYTPGKQQVAKTPTLFINLVATLIAQLKSCDDDMLKPGCIILGKTPRMDVKIDLVSQARYLVGNMVDSEIEGLVKKGQEFAAYLQQRGIVCEL